MRVFLSSLDHVFTNNFQFQKSRETVDVQLKETKFVKIEC
jgi:hypothetical protein